jgi:shikimate dehydrogenase
VEQSLSPLMHNAGYQALGLDYVYVPFRVKDVRQAVAGIRGLSVRGASVTIPHKTRAVEFMDNLDRIAIETGVINTIVNNDGVLTGYNTDYNAALQALKEATSIMGKKAVVLGGGGAGTAVAIALKRAGARLSILNRTEARLKDLAEMLDVEESGGLDKLDIIVDADILVNTTPVGMFPDVDTSPVPAEFLHSGLTVFDVVYNPKDTRLLKEARDKGCSIVYGYKMLLYQAAVQFELFTGQAAPVEVLERVLTEALG